MARALLGCERSWPLRLIDDQPRGGVLELPAVLAEHHIGRHDLPSQMDPEAAKRAAASAELIQRETRQRALHTSRIMSQTAEALETSAALAEEHAIRRERAGGEGALEERAAAERAHEGARRARLYAERWRDIAEREKP